ERRGEIRPTESVAAVETKIEAGPAERRLDIGRRLIRNGTPGDVGGRRGRNTKREHTHACEQKLFHNAPHLIHDGRARRCAVPRYAHSTRSQRHRFLGAIANAGHRGQSATPRNPSIVNGTAGCGCRERSAPELSTRGPLVDAPKGGAIRSGS